MCCTVPLQDATKPALTDSFKSVAELLEKLNVDGETKEKLKAKASSEVQWINKVNEISKGDFAIIEWTPEELKGEKLNDLID